MKRISPACCCITLDSDKHVTNETGQHDVVEHDELATLYQKNPKHAVTGI